MGRGFRFCPKIPATMLTKAKLAVVAEITMFKATNSFRLHAVFAMWLPPACQTQNAVPCAYARGAPGVQLNVDDILAVVNTIPQYHQLVVHVLGLHMRQQGEATMARGVEQLSRYRFSLGASHMSGRMHATHMQLTRMRYDSNKFSTSSISWGCAMWGRAAPDG